MQFVLMQLFGEDDIKIKFNCKQVKVKWEM